MKEALEGKLLISILAGVTISQMTAWVLPSTKVIRAMPNTPCKVRLSRSMTTYLSHVVLDSGRHDGRQHSSRNPRYRARSRHHPEDFLLHRPLPFSGGETLRCMYRPVRLRSGVCLHIPGSHGGRGRDDGSAPRRSIGVGCTESAISVSCPEHIVYSKLFMLALQGAARMALQDGAHPAQIKDAVTSTLPT